MSDITDSYDDEIANLLREQAKRKQEIRDLTERSSQPNIGESIAAAVSGLGAAIAGQNAPGAAGMVIDRGAKMRQQDLQNRLKALDDTQLMGGLAKLSKAKATAGGEQYKRAAAIANMVRNGLKPVYDESGMLIGAEPMEGAYVSPLQREANKGERAMTMAEGMTGRLGMSLSSQEKRAAEALAAKQASDAAARDAKTLLAEKAARDQWTKTLADTKKAGFIPRYDESGRFAEWIADPNYKPPTKAVRTLTPEEIAKIQAETELARARAAGIAKGKTAAPMSPLAQARIDEIAARRDERTREKADRAATDISKRFENAGIPEMVNMLSRLDPLIPGGLDSNQDIPGVGGTAWVPGAALSTQGQDIRSVAAEMRNVILKNRSGGAVTPQEADRLAEELNIGMTKTDRQLRQAIKNVKSKLSAGIKNMEAGYNPEYLQEYRNRPGGVSSQDPIFGRTSPNAQKPSKEAIIQELMRRKAAQKVGP